MLKNAQFIANRKRPCCHHQPGHRTADRSKRECDRQNTQQCARAIPIGLVQRVNEIVGQRSLKEASWHGDEREQSRGRDKRPRLPFAVVLQLAQGRKNYLREIGRKDV